MKCQFKSVCNLICAESGCHGLALLCDDGAICDYECGAYDTECPEYEKMENPKKSLTESVSSSVRQSVNVVPLGNDPMQHAMEVHHVFSTMNLMEIFAICSIVSFSLLGLCVQYMRYKEKEYDIIS